jgi:hypothetical protein
MNPTNAKWIRHTNSNGYRYPEWARIWAVVPGDGRECYLVEFPDGVTDYWAVCDPNEPYEFSDNPALP